MSKANEQTSISIKTKSHKVAFADLETLNKLSDISSFSTSFPNIPNFIFNENELGKMIGISNKSMLYISKSLISLETIKGFNLVNDSLLSQISKLQKNELHYIEKLDINTIFYNDVAQLCNQYNNLFNKDFLSHIIPKPIIQDYVDLQSRLLPKVEIMGGSKIFGLQNFYNGIANDIANFQFNTVNAFKSIGIIEERALNTDNIDIEANLYGKISQGLSPVYKENCTVKAEEVYKKTMVSDIYDTAKNVVANIIEVDKKSQLSGKCIFKPSVDMMVICFNLPTLIADDEQKFSNIIDWLYKALWKNRSKMEGYIDINDFNFINDLRIYYRHDLEHGKERDYKYKFLAVGDFFSSVIDKRYPTNSKEWQKAQLYIYNTIMNILLDLKLKLDD